MDFCLSEDAEMVRQTAHEFVRRDLLPHESKFLNTKDEAERRAMVQAATESLREMGLYSAGVPEEFGGGGLGPVETCLIAEELAHTLIPVEWGELTPLLYECSDAQQAAFLKPVVEGTKTYALAFQEPERFRDPASMKATAVAREHNYVLNGTKLLSRAGADFALVFVKAPEGPTCFLVDSETANGEVREANGVPVLALSGCAVSQDRMLGQPGKALQLGRKWFPLARITRAAAILGACDRLLEVNAQYAHDWNSLGRPIHERASIQQAIADMAGDVEALRWLVYHAAWLASEGKKVDYDSMLVKVQAHKVLTDTINRSVRIHGGTMPAIAEWLSKAASDDASDVLRFAVSRETISRLLP